MSDFLIRASQHADLASIAAIYSHHVLTGTASFETAPPDQSELSRRRSAVLQDRLPFLVASSGDAVVGYAYASLYRPRPAYRFTIEDSIYIHPDYLRRGVGRALLGELIKMCDPGPWRQMIAIIGDSANASSVRLHEEMGFSSAGILHSVGWKFGRWLDTVIMQRALGPGDQSAPPA